MDIYEPRPSAATPGRVDAVAAIGEALGVWRRVAVPIGLVALAAALPGLAYELMSDAVPEDADPRIAHLLGGSLLAWLSSVVAEGVAAPLVNAHVRGRIASEGGSLRLGLVRVLPLVGAALLIGISVSAGLVALIFPGLLLATGFFVTGPLVVLEGLSPTEAMGRSWTLTRGSRLSIFLAGLLIGLAGGAATIALTASLGEGPFWERVSSPTTRTTILSSVVYGAVFGGFSAVYSTVLFRRLRWAKEGEPTDTTAAVFE